MTDEATADLESKPEVQDNPAAEPGGQSPRRRAVSVAVRVLVNVVVALPFLILGILGLMQGDQLYQISFAVILVGALVVLVGIYVSVLSRPRLNLTSGEEVLALRHPSMKPPFARIALSIPFFAAAGYLLEFTALPYLYPFLPFLAGMYFYFRGIIKYWINHHTTYYVTNHRAVRMYRFGWLDTTEIPVNAINAISQSRSLLEMLTGRGSVLVASGIGSHQKVLMEEIDNPGPVADTVRRLIR